MSSSQHSSNRHGRKASSSTKGIDYMPSRRNGKHTYDSKKQFYSDVRHSPFIPPYISTSARQHFNIVTHHDATGARSPPRLNRSWRASSSKSFHSSKSPGLGSPSSAPSAVAHPVISSPLSPLLPSSPPSLSPPTPPSGLAPTIAIEDDRFTYRCIQALRIAVAAETALKAEETHIWARIREEELVLGLLHDEVEVTGSRRKAAMHQVKSIYDEARLVGLELPDKGKLEHEAYLSLGPGSSPSPPTSPGQLFSDLTVDMMNCPHENTPESSNLSPLLSLTSLPLGDDELQVPQHSPDVQASGSSQNHPYLRSLPTTSPTFDSTTPALDSGAANGA